VKITKTQTALIPKAVSFRRPLASTVSASRLVSVETKSDENIVYTPISNGVRSLIPVTPAIVPQIDTLKLQIHNRINSGIISGHLTEAEAAEIQAAVDELALQEANFKLTYGGVNSLVLANMLPKYHKVNIQLDDLLANTNRADYMPAFDLRRSAMRNHIAYHQAAGNLTPAESEQLLAALNGISDQYASIRATGGTVSADELEQLHLDLFNLKKKLADRISAPIARVCPEVIVKESDVLRIIREGMAARVVSPAEANRLINQYNQMIVLRQSIAADTGYQSPDMVQFMKEIDNLRFVLNREIRDRQIAGSSNRF
jgi:hypothetical protein